MRFDQILQEKMKVLFEAPPDSVGQPPTPQAPPAGNVPGIGAESPPAAQPPAPPQPVTFDKPYQDLGRLLYHALRVNFDEWPDELKHKIHNIAPDGAKSIESDEDGVSLFKAVEDAINELKGVSPSKEEQ